MNDLDYFYNEVIKIIERAANTRKIPRGIANQLIQDITLEKMEFEVPTINESIKKGNNECS